MSEIATFDLVLAMTDVDIADKQKAQENVEKMFAENKDYKYDASKTLSENIVAALPQYRLGEYAKTCEGVFRTFKNFGSDFSQKKDLDDFKNQCIAYLSLYKLPEKINPADKENPYRERVELGLPDLLSVMTGRVIQDVYYRGAYDKVGDMIALKEMRDDKMSMREKIAAMFPEYPLEKFAQEFERSVEVAKMMGLDERKGFTVEAVKTLAKGYDFPEKFVVEEKLPEKSQSNALDHAREMVKAKMQQDGAVGISKEELVSYKQMKGKSKETAQKETDTLFNRIGNPRDL